MVVCGLALVSVTLLGLFQYRASRRFASDAAWVSHTYDALQQLTLLRNNLNRADASAQRFAISGNADDLETYRRSATIFATTLGNLHQLFADNPNQVRRFAILQSRMSSSMAAFQQEMDVPAAQRLVPGKLQSFDKPIRDANNATRQVIGEMEGEELELLQKRTADSKLSNHNSNALILLATLTAFVLLATAAIALQINLVRRRHVEEISRQTEERFRLMVEGVFDYAMYMLDQNGHITGWNAGAERIKGYTSAEILGKHFSCFYTPEDRSSGKPQNSLNIAAAEGHAEQEGWRIRKDGSKLWANVVITARRDPAGKLLGFSKVTRDVTERMQAQHALRREIAERTEIQQKLLESEESMRRLSLHLLRTQDEERQRIGRDMHDSLGQYLGVLKMRLDALQSSQTDPASEISMELEQCTDLLTECVKEVRTISYLLYPPMLEEVGLKSAIPWYLDGFSHRSGIKTTFEFSSDFGRLGRDAELALFRVLQEALTNVHRHSGSATADIQLARRDGVVIMEIRDHGKGAPPEVLQQSGSSWKASWGVGLRGMEERLRQLGGQLDVLTSEKGTVVRATIPIKESSPADTELDKEVGQGSSAGRSSC